MGENLFCLRLREMMKKQNMRQIDLARITGLDKSAIHGYYIGRNVPQDVRLQLIAAALQCDPLWLAGYDGIEEDEDAAFLTMWRQLSAEDKRTVGKMLQYLTDANKKDDAKR